MDARRGGIQQRLASAEQATQASSAVAMYLLKEYAWGRMSAVQVQRIAGLAMQDVEAASTGLKFPDLQSLSRLGSSGSHPQNCFRDICTAIGRLKLRLPPLCEVQLPSIKKNEGKVAILFPHEIFAHMFEYHREAWKKQFMPDGSPEKFWKQCKRLPCLQYLSRPFSDDSSKAIPIGIHGDEVPVAGRGKVYVKLSIVFTWFSLLCHSLPTKDSLLWIWACAPQCFKDGSGGTIEVFWKLLAWSLNSLATGTWPSHDYRGVAYPPGSKERARAGQPLAAGFHCVLVSLVGDMDYFAKFLQLPHWTGAARSCTLCRCSKWGHLSWKDFREEAGWRGTIFTTATWKADVDASEAPIFSALNVSGLTVAPDLMHTKYLGYQQYFLGSVLYLLCFYMLPGTPLQNLHAVGLQIFKYQKKCGMQNRMPLSFFRKLSIFVRKSGFPKMRGKGGQIKSLGPAIGSCFKKHMSSGNTTHRRIALIFKLDQEIESTLGDYAPVHGFYALPAVEAQAVRKKQMELSQLLVQLEAHFAEEDTPLFNVVSKLHAAAHIFDNARCLHPFLTWCWKGEDFMHTASILLGSCLRGRTDAGATIKAGLKYCLAMRLAWGS